MILLYWDIGRGIVEKQEALGWGKSVVETLSRDLKIEFPQMTGFSSDNLWRMRQFYSGYSSPEFLSQAREGLNQLKIVEFLEQTVPESQNRIAKEILEHAVPENLAQVVRDLVALVPWGHHVEIMKSQYPQRQRTRRRRQPFYRHHPVCGERQPGSRVRAEEQNQSHWGVGISTTGYVAEGIQRQNPNAQTTERGPALTRNKEAQGVVHA